MFLFYTWIAVIDYNRPIHFRHSPTLARLGKIVATIQKKKKKWLLARHAPLPIKKINQSDLFPRVEERSFPKFNPNSNGMNNRKREKKGIASFSPAKFLGKTTDRPPVELIARFSANEQTRRTSYVLVDTEQHSLSLSYRQKSHDKPVDVYFPNTYVYTCMYIYIYTCS